jgi:hypothetical protein
LSEDAMREERIEEVMNVFDWCESEGLHPLVSKKSGRVFISSGGVSYETEEEFEAFGDEFLERASVWRPFTTELYELNETEEGRSILSEAYGRWQEQE